MGENKSKFSNVSPLPNTSFIIGAGMSRLSQLSILTTATAWNMTKVCWIETDVCWLFSQMRVKVMKINSSCECDKVVSAFWSFFGRCHLYFSDFFIFASGPTGTDACIDLESRLITAVWMNDTRWTKSMIHAQL